MNTLTRTLWFISALAMAGCTDDRPEPSENNTTEKPEVTVTEVQLWQSETNRALPGVMRPGKRAVISTRMTGTLKTVEVEPGDQVTTGQPLATVDSREVESAIDAAKSNVQAAGAALEQAKQEHERLQRLYEEDLIARVRMERAGVRIRELKAQLHKAKAELQNQQTTLDYTRLSAPFNGMVAETLIDPGSFVGPGQALMVLEARDRLRVDVPVSSQVAASLTPGQVVSVVAAKEGRTLPAHLISIIPALDGQATGQRLRLQLEPGASELAPGQVVTVLIPTTDSRSSIRTQDWVALPENALIRRGQLTGTLVLEQNGEEAVVHLKWIKTANPPENQSDMIPVTEGLSPGELVVLAPSSDLRDGQKVSVKLAGADNGQR
ncbi:efflux RND transporter periplasmic adaptor subunit [Marinobacter sp.]|uniref:efflux RND transporter periplasmic adaptor subunit n=1 Tax=Marinobacter sp. TaxID=50741 RepID=UPI003568183A